MASVAGQSSFLPTIKCSSCGRQVEISMMGEHVCGKSAGLEPNFMPQNQLVHQEIGRIPALPRVDTAAANRNYYRAGQLTPASNSSGSRSISPRTPTGRPSAGRPEDMFAPRIAYDESLSTRQLYSGGYGGYPDGDEVDPLEPVGPHKQDPALLAPSDSLTPRPIYDGMQRTRQGRQGSADSGRTSSSERGGRRPSTSSSNKSNKSASTRTSRPIREGGYGGFGLSSKRDDFEPKPFGAAGRAGTFPNAHLAPAIEAPLRTPSAPGPRPERRRTPSEAPSSQRSSPRRRPSMTPDLSRVPPPRTSLMPPPPTGPGGTLTSVNLAAEFGIGNPYHTPSQSMSSSISSYSRPSDSSSQSSPPRSVRSAPERKRSNPTNFDTVMSDLQSSMEALTPREGPYDTPLASPVWPSPSRDHLHPSNGRRPSAPRICKGCNDVIIGKSVSSADGRLTGRYHKACFVCSTCANPFDTTTFYVHHDRPYCSRHYHEINGSMCGVCDIGIEGQYLADESDRKYHPKCFTCADPRCRRILDDGYFEVDGRYYCERDAWRIVNMQQHQQHQQQHYHPHHQYHPSIGAGGRQMGGGPPMRNGLPGRPSVGMQSRLGPPGRPQNGPSNSSRLAPMPKMQKRMTRLGIM